MDYQLESFLAGRTTRVQNPSWAAVLDALKALWDYRYEKPWEDYGFVILSATEAVEDCLYVQVAQDYGGQIQGLEARFQRGNGFEHYHIDTTLPTTLKAFEAFMKGERVDTAGWEDWTGEMSPAEGN